jgi:hypothetical protein
VISLFGLLKAGGVSAGVDPWNLDRRAYRNRRPKTVLETFPGVLHILDHL